jgi:predicted dehydrogenase
MTTRRTFLKSTAGGAAGLLVGGTAKSHARILGANDRVRVGIVGFADRTQDALLPALLHHGQELGFEVVAVSDIWRIRREQGVAALARLTGRECVGCRNNEELYERKDVDAVVIATADFQHAVHCVEAIRAGRHAYVEKPLANTMEDARAVLDAARASGCIVQVGTQRRSGDNYIRANDYVRSGAFGAINMVEMTWNVNQPGRWRRPKLVAQMREEDTDWTRFLINRPRAPFDARRHIEYRLFWPYSSGIPCQWMVHQIDTVHWFTGLSRPRSVVANGGIYQWNDGRANFDTMTAVFDYGPSDGRGGFQVLYSSRMGNDAGGVKELYFSNGGTLDLDRNTVGPEGGLTQRQAEVMGLSERLLPLTTLSTAGSAVTDAVTGVDPMTSAHVRNWMECVRGGRQPNAPIEAGYDHSVALCMTIAALHTGRRVTFDDVRRDVVVA